MSKFNIIVADPPWSFSDQLKMSDVKRGASSHYNTINFDELLELDVPKLVSKDALLALWVPSSMLSEGLKLMEAWGFEQKQTWIWVKIKVDPLESLKKSFSVKPLITSLARMKEIITSFNMDDILAFGMGRLFRNTHEIALIGTKGKIGAKLANKSQRTVHLYKALHHSAKPEALQDRLDIMFPKTNKIELFSRRERKGYVCIGNEAPNTLGEDIRTSIERLTARKRKNEGATTELQL